jgi:hypothetical protein
MNNYSVTSYGIGLRGIANIQPICIPVAAKKQQDFLTLMPLGVPAERRL